MHSTCMLLLLQVNFKAMAKAGFPPPLLQGPCVVKVQGHSITERHSTKGPGHPSLNTSLDHWPTDRPYVVSHQFLLQMKLGLGSLLLSQIKNHLLRFDFEFGGLVHGDFSCCLCCLSPKPLLARQLFEHAEVVWREFVAMFASTSQIWVLARSEGGFFYFLPHTLVF